MLNSRELADVAKLEELFEQANSMRRQGAGDREAVLRFMREAGVQTSMETVLYRHLLFHAGLIKPTTHDRFLVCPVCEARLDVD